ncbi:hypothetical protein KXV52_007678 [Aspergillus fumigatus]|nr:hypothetical protein KXX48_001277 [Aspergillus fumigatus]KAH1314206.1 hypothetical protein KXX47_004068 [Aspergillus fumigatus]KAH1392304.1 hypothetical protein KXX49_001609 [Aspergillus fumigatus]KAH1621844.1 hypothetical protein KXX31_006338 [Aspergillus fumigatus]KAH1676496.1 hypothetical protein KXX65_001702 [Aspergillus fumigatus]
MPSIKNSTIVIFGGSSGIGYGVADKCLSEGAVVHISSSNPTRITQAVSSLKEKYPEGQVTGHTCDLSLPDVEQGLVKLFEEIGSCDHIVYTAGDALAVRPLKDLDLQFIQKAGHIRFDVPLLVAKLALRVLKPGYTSSLILTGGAVGDRPQPDWAVVAGYAAGLYGMVRGLALDMKPLRVNFVSPGPVKTGLFTDELAEMFAKRTTLGKVGSVEEAAEAVLQLAEEGRLNHFEYHPDRLQDAVQYVINIIKRDFGPDKYHLIPPHGRWQHFEVGGVSRPESLLKQWKSDGANPLEQTRDRWRFTEPDTDIVVGRSEGTALASYNMFVNGDFSTVDSERRDVVMGQALKDFDAATLQRGFQIDEKTNPLVGASSRVELLRALGQSLLNLPEIFGPAGRPGNLVDYLLSQSSTTKEINYETLWTTLQTVLLPVWPSSRTHIDGRPLGDAWPLQVLADDAQGTHQNSKCAHIQPFHKLTQWLAYSLTVPFERLLGVKWTNMDLGTGLPEYRNGGLFVDLGVLTLKPAAEEHGRHNSGSTLPAFEATSDEIVEWRAMTVALLDKLHEQIMNSEVFSGVRLRLAQVLEAGSWKAGRELAAEKRPETRSSPILILGDGTLF